jgi:peptide/nickel transport system ATP-binding protein
VNAGIAANEGVPILAAKGMVKHFPLGGGWFGRSSGSIAAVDDCSLALDAGETLGVVGESGCGKSTLARMLIDLILPDSGRVEVEGSAINLRSRADIRRLRRAVQMVFQDSYASLNPRHTAAEEVAFGLSALGHPRRDSIRRASEALRHVGLTPELFSGRYPHELSGGQRQRVNIARALAIEPKVLILDEAVSALDKSVQAQVLNLLVELKAKLALSYIFISHDLDVVRFISDRVVVMYLGKVMEIGPVERIYQAPAHQYTKALIASRLSMNPAERTSRPPLAGDPPSPVNPPPGCRFAARCPIVEPVCRTTSPILHAMNRDSSHLTSCLASIPGSGHTQAPLASTGDDRGSIGMPA